MVLQVVKKFVRLGKADDEGTIQGYRQRWIYSIGGMQGGDQKVAIPNKTIERYDVVGDQWTRIKCLLNYNQSFASSVVVNDRFIYVFKGDIDSCTFEVLDIEMANTWQHCKKIAVAMEIELTSSQVFFITEEECLLILGGTDNQSVEAFRDDNSSNQDEEDDQEEVRPAKRSLSRTKRPSTSLLQG